ncbi:MAG TPA: GNVR domain-containing protein, partial [Gemmatimonadaceae bacterium]|nr:GNVR domain-containing protein [Gemmatimonadaceae bacterium]
MPWTRYIAALKRHKWIILLFVVVGSALGWVVSRRVQAEYDVLATVRVVVGGQEGGGQSGPIRAGTLHTESGWIELLRSYSIGDSVVRQLRLNIEPSSVADTALFTNFRHVSEGFRPGTYVLTVGLDGRSYSLASAGGDVLEKGQLTDSIGRKLGFLWQIPGGQLAPERKIQFAVMQPRDASNRILSRMVTILPEGGQVIRLRLTGHNPKLDAQTLNTWVRQFIAEATTLKKRNLVEFRKLVEAQLQVAERELRNAEIGLESFRVNTITLPSEGAQMQGGIEATRDPVLNSYFERRSAYDSVRQSREQLEQLVARSGRGAIAREEFLTIPAIVASTPNLAATLSELDQKRAELRTLQQTLTDAHPRVRALAEGIRVLEQETVPRIVSGVLQSTREREREMQQRVAGASRELQRIPPRTIEEMRLRRQVAASENLYNNLKNRYEEVKLAEAGTTPDVSIGDTAIAPRIPSSNAAPRMLLLAILASFGAAVGLALLHDRLDRRFRYPEQVTRDLGLLIAGAVPRLRPNRRGQLDVVAMSQVVEAFRALRLSARYNFELGAPVVLNVSSPSAGDGKSLVSSNLAVSFANAGCRTLLIDGDVRRGALH